MQFLIYGAVHPEAPAALVRHEHVCHTLLELSGETDAPAEAGENIEVLLELIGKKQWNLVTTDTDLVRELYEKKIAYAGVIVLILDDPDDLHDQGQAIDRLFERYKRLTPGRLYTVTPSRVKIRQLPGGHMS
ncbi:MAG TPA: hypothetical protein VHM90_00390 [Phycisphaerae bacterium]|nr:hypothetical protein [Phycisphaerae bacterium]